MSTLNKTIGDRIGLCSFLSAFLKLQHSRIIALAVIAFYILNEITSRVFSLICVAVMYVYMMSFIIKIHLTK